MELLMDRNHYRQREDANLLEQARYNPTAELAVVLAERLEEVQAELDGDIEKLKDRAEDLQIDLNQMDDKVYLLQAEIARGESIIAGMAAEIAYLKEQQNVQD